jgi:dipeptidyl aminopeptidase/acylaminoacyl peptidase
MVACNRTATPAPAIQLQASAEPPNLTWVSVDASLTPIGEGQATLDSLIVSMGIYVPTCYFGAVEISVYSEGNLIWQRASRDKIGFVQPIPLITSRSTVSPDSRVEVARGDAFIQVDYFTVAGVLDPSAVQEGQPFCQLMPESPDLVPNTLDLARGYADWSEQPEFQQGSFRIDIPAAAPAGQASSPPALARTVAAGTAHPTDVISQRPSGRLLYVQNVEDYWTFSFDGTGSSLLLPRVNNFHFTWSSSGTRVAYSPLDLSIHVMNIDGTADKVIVQANFRVENISMSPDGTTVALAAHPESGRPSQLYVFGIDGSGPTRLTDLPDFVRDMLAWSPDGSHVLFATFEPNRDLYVVNSDGTNLINLTHGLSLIPFGASWSPDGARIAMAAMEDVYSNESIYLMNADGTGLKRVTDDFGSFAPSWSPDGSHIVFVSLRDFSSSECQPGSCRGEDFTEVYHGSRRLQPEKADLL